MLESLLPLAGHSTSSFLFQAVTSPTYRKYIMWLLITNHYIMDMYMYYVDSTCTLLSMTLTVYIIIIIVVVSVIVATFMKSAQAFQTIGL